MKIGIEWKKPVPLVDGSKQRLIYVVDPEKLPDAAGVYIFCRLRHNGSFEALYVGKTKNIRRRVWGHRKNLPLMMHLKHAKRGKLFVRVGIYHRSQGQNLNSCLLVAERALIRHFLSDGHDLVNKAGTRLRRHEISSVGRHPNKFIPKTMFIDK